MSADDKLTQTILSNTQKKLLDIISIPGTAETGVNAIDHVNTTMTILDTINATYLQPLKIFDTVINSIANISVVA